MIIYQYHSDQFDNPNQAEVEGHNVDPDEVLQGGLGVPGDYGIDDHHNDDSDECFRNGSKVLGIIVLRITMIIVFRMAQTCCGC